MRIGVADIASGWSGDDDRQASPAAPTAAPDDALDAGLPGGLLDPHLAVADVETAADLMVGILGTIDENAGLDTLEAVVPALRRRLDALEGEFARLTVALQQVSSRPETGTRSLVTWLARHSGSAQRRIAASLHLGRDLEEHPCIAERVQQARMSVDNARVVSEIAGHPSFAADADELLAAAETQTPRQLRHTIDGWLARIPAALDEPGPADDADIAEDEGDDPPDAEVRNETELERRRRLAFLKRYLRAVPAQHGMVRLEGLLASADAHALMGRLADIASFGVDDSTERTWPQRLADAAVELAAVDGTAWAIDHGKAPQMTIRPTLVGIAEAPVLDGRHHGGGTTASGEVADRAQLREMACTADRWTITTHHGVAIDSRKDDRLFSLAQYLAMVGRDGRCRIPGCEAPPERCQTHHIDHVERGGETRLSRGVLTCFTHHHWLHATGARFVGDADGDLWLLTPDGRTEPANPALGVLPAGPPVPPRRYDLVFQVA